MNCLKFLGLVCLLGCTHAAFALSESDLATQAPACTGKMAGIPPDVKTEKKFGNRVRAVSWIDINADGQCDAVAYSQETMDDDGEQIVIFFLYKDKHYQYRGAYTAGRTISVMPVYTTRGGPPFIVIHFTRSKSGLPSYLVLKWDAEKNRLENIRFYGFQSKNFEKMNYPEANTVMRFYVNDLIDRTTKSLSQGKPPAWQQDEISSIAQTINGEPNLDLRGALMSLSDKIDKTPPKK